MVVDIILKKCHIPTGLDGFQVQGSRFRVQGYGLHSIETVDDTASDPEYLEKPSGWNWIILTKSKFSFDKWCLRFST